jgi:hypothetical protein
MEAYTLPLPPLSFLTAGQILVMSQHIMAYSPTCQFTIRLRSKMIQEDRNVATTQKVNFGQVIFQLSPTIKRIVRKIESLSKKIINAGAAISFNKICLSDDILPNYTNI